MAFIEIVIFGLSVCADCFAVSLCSATSLDKGKRANNMGIALCFALIQTSFLLIGWGFGDILEQFIENIAKWVALALLLYVGGQMLYSAFICRSCEKRNLRGFKNIFISAVATSIDALAIGSGLALGGEHWGQVMPKAISVFICTAASVILGITGGGKIAHKTGHWAEGIGGAILIAIGISIVL